MRLGQIRIQRHPSMGHCRNEMRLDASTGMREPRIRPHRRGGLRCLRKRSVNGNAEQCPNSGDTNGSSAGIPWREKFAASVAALSEKR